MSRTQLYTTAPLRLLLLSMAGILSVAGCNGGSESAAAAHSSPPPPAGGSGTPGPTPGVNAAPTISGVPADTGAAGTYYAFAPVATDPNGDALTFSVENLPAWATFSDRSGTLSGMLTSADVGAYAAIRIAVTDGSLATALPAFVINVTPAVPTAASATYRGFTYSLPTTRPFIALNDYAASGRSSAAYLRLKAQVDDAVAVTNALPANGTYSQLITALNADHYGYSAVDSVIMFRLSGDTRYIQQAIRMVELFVASENVKIAAGAAPEIAGDSYLYVGPNMEQLALTYDYGYDRLTAAQRTAWSAFAEQAIFNVWNYATAQWGNYTHPWSGWSVNDAGNNYFYSFLKATQLWALASQSTTWINFLQTKKYSLLVPFFNSLQGGGSREGTGYGTALGNLFEDYAYWKASTGEDLASYSSHARDTIDYWIHATVPTFDYFASIGDQARVSMPVMFDYQRKLVEEAVTLYPGTAQGGRGRWWLNRIKVTDGGTGFVLGTMRYNFDFRYDLLPTTGTEQAPSSLLYDASGTGALFARSDWSTSASWMDTNAGPYDQSHAHQDQGSFSFFKNTWLAVTSNVYSNSGINQGVDVENVMRFMAGGSAIPQNQSVSSKAVADSGGVVQINENLSAAYADSAGQVSSWLRDLTYTRQSHSIKVHDRCVVAAQVTPIWQLHTPVAPVRQSDGSYLAGKLRISPRLPASPSITIVNMHSLSSEFNDGYRFELAGSSGSCEFEVDLQAQ